jgi:predicted nucleotidyltransferase
VSKARDKVIQALRADEPNLRARFGVRSLALFGSVARNESKEGSDVDLLVEFDRAISLFDLVAVQQYLERLLDAGRVDVTVRESIYPALRENILGEAVHVYGEEMEVSR